MSKHRPKSNPGHTANTAHPSIQPASASNPPTEPLGLKRRHFMGTALALDAAALLAACGGGGGNSGGTGMSGSGSGSGSGSSSANSSSSASGSSSASSSASSSGSGSGSGSAIPINWVVTTLAGSGLNWTLIDGTGATATFNGPAGIAVDTNGYVYVAEPNFHCVRKISPAGVVRTLAGGTATGALNGTGGTATFDNPWGVSLDTSGNLFVSETVNSDLRKITPAGVVSTLAFTGTGSQFTQPRGVNFDASGNLFVADSSNHRIRKVTSAGVVSTWAGMGVSGFANGTGTMANFQYPYDVALDSTGAVYVADTSNHMVRKITPAGVVSTLAGTGTAGSANGTGTNASFNYPRGVAIDAGGAVYVADYGNHLIRKITPEGVVSILAGTGTIGSANGTGTQASFKNPVDIALDGSGNLWVTDSGNHQIRKITPIY